MKKSIISMLILIAWGTSLSAQRITRTQADEIATHYVKNAAGSPDLCALYVHANAPNGEGFSLTTLQEETIKAKYACWVYYLNENVGMSEPSTQRYLFVKEEGGNLAEVITHNDRGPGDLSAWTSIDLSTDLETIKENPIRSLHPNPVDELVTLTYSGELARVEIYDLKGALLFSGSVSGKDTAQLNVSFLSSGSYLVNVHSDTKMTYKMIKK